MKKKSVIQPVQFGLLKEKKINFTPPKTIRALPVRSQDKWRRQYTTVQYTVTLGEMER